MLWKTGRNYPSALKSWISLSNYPRRSWNLEDSPECGTEQGTKASALPAPFACPTWSRKRGSRYLSHCCTLRAMVSRWHNSSVSSLSTGTLAQTRYPILAHIAAVQKCLLTSQLTFYLLSLKGPLQRDHSLSFSLSGCISNICPLMCSASSSPSLVLVLPFFVYIFTVILSHEYHCSSLWVTLSTTTSPSPPGISGRVISKEQSSSGSLQTGFKYSMF